MKLNISCFKKICLTLSYFKKIFHISYIKKKQIVLRFFFIFLQEKRNLNMASNRQGKLGKAQYFTIYADIQINNFVSPVN